MLINKVRKIVIIVVVLIIVLQLVNCLNELKLLKTEEKDNIPFEDVCVEEKTTEPEYVDNAVTQDLSHNFHNIKTMTRVNNLRGELSTTEYNEYGDIIYSREEKQEEVDFEVNIEWHYYSCKKVGIQNDGKKIVIELDAENRPVKLFFYDENDCLTYQEQYEYYNGTISKKENIVCAGEEIFSQVTLVYNSHGDIEMIKHSQVAGIDYIIKYFYEYDHNGKKKSGYSVENNELSGEITRTLKYSYDENGALITEEQFTEDNILELTIKYKYDEMGNVIEEFYDHELFDYNDKILYYTYY